MKVNIHLFTFLYLFILCLAPLFIFIILHQKQKNTKFLNTIWLFFYFVISFFLTQFSVSLNKYYISFYLPQNKFFSFSFANGMNLHNFIINFALCLPLGIIIFCFNKNNSIFNKSNFQINPAFSGLLFASTIEVLQIILPNNRFFDPADFIFAVIVTSFIYLLTKIYFNFTSKKERFKTRFLRF